MTNTDGKKPINLICPRCDHFIPNDQSPGEYPGALSRHTADGLIEVCSQCGTDEAMMQFGVGPDPDAMARVVHPVHGHLTWHNPKPTIGL